MKELTADIVVVAAGPAGLAAAISAAEDGASVLVIEKSKTTGGAGNMGMGPLGIDTSVQKEELSSLTVDKAFKMFMEYTHWRVDANLVKKYFEKSADTIDWLKDMGVEFYKAAKYFSGSENTWHIIKPESGEPGPRSASTMIKFMTKHASKLGVTFLFETKGKGLNKTVDRITSVMAEGKDGEEILINCKAAIIATGGFGDNPKLIKERIGLETDKDYFGFRIPGLVGDGIRMAHEVGGGDTEVTIELTTTLPGEGVTNAVSSAFHQPNLLVNLQGERFFNEEYFENVTYAGNAVNIQKDRCGIMIFDESIKRFYMKRGLDALCLVRGNTDMSVFDQELELAISQGNTNLFKADTLEALAELTGINSDKFLETVEEYNDFCDSRDEVFGKSPKFMKPIHKAPFYAAKYYPGGYGTLGGIKINHKTEVITNNHEVIKGLYAAGTDTCTIFGDSYMFLLPGNTMGYALNSGRMAGENAAEYIE